MSMIHCLSATSITLNTNNAATNDDDTGHGDYTECAANAEHNTNNDTVDCVDDYCYYFYDYDSDGDD